MSTIFQARMCCVSGWLWGVTRPALRTIIRLFLATGIVPLPHLMEASQVCTSMELWLAQLLEPIQRQKQALSRSARQGVVFRGSFMPCRTTTMLCHLPLLLNGVRRPFQILKLQLRRAAKPQHFTTTSSSYFLSLRERSIIRSARP